MRYLRIFLRTMMRWRKMELVHITISEVAIPIRPVMQIARLETMMLHTQAATMPFFSRNRKERKEEIYPRWLWWRTAFAVLWESGVRRAELLGLKWANVQFENSRVKLDSAFTKTKKSRFACLGELSISLLRQLREHATSDCISLEMQAYVFPYPHRIESFNTSVQANIKGR